jgi:hypothetical protein
VEIGDGSAVIRGQGIQDGARDHGLQSADTGRVHGPPRAVGLGPSGVSLSPFLLRVDTSTDWLVVVRDGNEPDLRFRPEITLLYLVWKHFFLFS